MEPPNDYANTCYSTEQNKLTAATRKQLHFYEGKHAFISIDRSIVDKLELSESDRFTEEIVEDGILLKLIEDTAKKKNGDGRRFSQTHQRTPIQVQEGTQCLT